jgi:phosphate starvation-inducible PhoH-like protein
MKRPTKATRRDREEGRVDTQARNSARKAPKPQWAESNGIHKFQLSQAQQELSDKIDQNDLVFCIGPAGTGKSLGILHNFVREYLKDSTKQIIVIRTAVQVGMDDVGALPDSLEAKIEPHFASSKNLLEQLLSKGKVETDLGHRLHFKIPNFVLGATFDNSLVFIDEAQQLPPLILKLLLERIGMNSKVVVAGDNSQLYVDAKGRNALIDAVPRFFDKEDGEYVPRYPYVDMHLFDVEDVQRSDLVKTVIRAYGSSV